MNIRLRPKLLLLFLLSSLLPLAVTGWVALRWLGEEANATARTRAATALEVKKNRVEQYLAKNRTDMDALASGTQALYNRQVQKLEGVRDRYGAAVQQRFREWAQETEQFAATDQVAKNLVSIDWVFRDGGEKITGDRWPAVAATMTPNLNRFREKQGFDNVYLVSAQGNVVLGAVPDALVGKNLLRSPLKESGAGRLFPAAMNKSSFQDFSPFAPLNGEPTAWLGTPIRKDGVEDGKIVGLLAVRFSPALLTKIFSSLEATDQAIQWHLIGPDRLRRAGSGPGPAGMEKSTAPAMLSALAGTTGAGALKGVDGQGVFSAWAPLQLAPLALPQDPPWAVVVEQSIAQTFAAEAKGGTPFYKTQMEQSGYYDFFLIDPEGDIFFSATRQADFGTNVVHGQYANTNLGRLVRQVLAKQAFAVTDFEPYPPSNNEPAAFMAQPMVQEGSIRMVLALQLPLETLTALMQHRDGLESEGDAYLVGPDRRMRSDSIRDPKKRSVLASFAGSIRENGADSSAIQAALAGQSGQSTGTNWFGKPVFTAFAPLQAGPEITWAVVTETPLLQGMLPLHLLPMPIWLAASLSLLGCMGIAWATATTMRRTLFRCVESLQGMQEGHVAPNSMAGRRDEFGMVAREVQGVAVRWQQVASRLRDSGAQVARIGVELSDLAQRTLAAQPRTGALGILEAGEAATRESAARVQQHLKQVQAMEQWMGRLNQALAQSKSTLEQTVAAAREIADKTALFTEAAQQTNQLSMKATFEVVAASDGKGGRRLGPMITEIQKLVERGRIFADEVGELSLGMTYMVENTQALLGNMAAALQESAALTQGMALADTTHHGQMVHIHGMTQTLRGQIQGHSAALQNLAPIAQALAQQVVGLQKELAFFSPDKGAANQAIASEEERLATDELALQSEEEGP